MFAPPPIVEDPLSAESEGSADEIFEPATIAGARQLHDEGDLDDHGFWVVAPAEAAAASTTESELIDGDDDEPEGWSRGRRVALAGAGAVLVAVVLILLFRGGGDDSSVTAAPTTRARPSTTSLGTSTSLGPATTFVPIVDSVETTSTTLPMPPATGSPRRTVVNVTVPPTTTEGPLPNFDFLTTTTTTPPTTTIPEPSISFSINPGAITTGLGGWPQLAWSVSGATSVLVEGAYFSSSATNFVAAVCPEASPASSSCDAPPGVYTYTLTVAWAGGPNIVRQVNLTINPDNSTTTTLAP